MHLDLHVDDPRAAHSEAIALGARLLQAAPDLGSDEGRQVYADPAGHPFCIGWGHPSREALAKFVADGLSNYSEGRNRPDTDGSSCLSPYLRWGELSPFEVWHALGSKRSESASISWSVSR